MRMDRVKAGGAAPPLGMPLGKVCGAARGRERERAKGRAAHRLARVQRALPRPQALLAHGHRALALPQEAPLQLHSGGAARLHFSRQGGEALRGLTVAAEEAAFSLHDRFFGGELPLVEVD